MRKSCYYCTECQGCYSDPDDSFSEDKNYFCMAANGREITKWVSIFEDREKALETPSWCPMNV